MLKYLFTAYFENGEFYCQPENDISQIDPTKSAFYDVLEKDKAGNKLQIFCLSNGVDDYLIDLRDGTFRANGRPFNIHNREHYFSEKRLIYFRRNIINLTQGLAPEQDCYYKLGWQANNATGNNEQYVIEFN